MKIHIYYRHYNIFGNDGKNRPHWFRFENCFSNFLYTLPGHSSGKYRLNAVYDGDIYDDNFIKPHSCHDIFNIKAGNDKDSFFQTVEIIKQDNNIQPGDLIYFLENDYLHLDGWYDKVIDLFESYSGIDYVTLYDHNDKYFLPQYQQLVSKILTTKDHHWRSTPSTCGSFIISKETFDKDYDILREMVGDHNKFLYLNEHRGRTVLSALPGLSTHVMEGLMSPTINWEKI